MSRKPTLDPGTAPSYVELRRARILAHAGGEPRRVRDGDPVPEGRIEHLCCEAEDLYWNELAWEELMGEEIVDGGRLTELVFPAFLAFIDGLLPKGAAAERARPAAVEEILAFLGEQFVRFSAALEGGIDSGRVVWARLMTARLIDLVLYRLYALSPAQREQLELID
jgi:hypothetical protein